MHQSCHGVVNGKQILGGVNMTVLARHKICSFWRSGLLVGLCLVTFSYVGRAYENPNTKCPGFSLYPITHPLPNVTSLLCRV